MVELHSLIYKRLRREAEALLLPESVIVDFRPHDLLHQILRVRASYVLRQRIRPVRHGRREKPRNRLVAGIARIKRRCFRRVLPRICSGGIRRH